MKALLTLVKSWFVKTEPIILDVIRHPIVDAEHEFKTLHWTPEGYTHFTIEKKQ